MKILKFAPEQIDKILSNEYTSTWRLADEKNIQVDDEIQLINSENGQSFANIIVDKITIKRISDINETDMVGHAQYETKDDILNSFRKYYGNNISFNSTVKIISFHLNSKQTDVKKVTSFEKVKLFTDGGSRGNPGPSATGYVIYDEQDNVLFAGGDYLGVTTNNQAEYQAVRTGLKQCQQFNPKHVQVFMDSLLVVNQMNGVFKIKNRDLWPIHSDIKAIAQKFDKVTFTHVPRELNKAADAEVNKVLDSADV